MVTGFFIGIGFAALTPLRYLPFYKRVGFARSNAQEPRTYQVLEKRISWFPGPHDLVVPTISVVPPERVGFTVYKAGGFGAKWPMLCEDIHEAFLGSGGPVSAMGSVRIAGWWVFAP